MLKILAGLLCFFVFPMLLLNSGIKRFFSHRYKIKREKLHFEMRQNLRLMENFADGRHYSHFLLKKMCMNAGKSQNWQNSIAIGILRLKKHFPGSFVFIVTDNEGNLVNHLTEIKEYRFLFKKTIQLARELKMSVKKDFPGYPRQISDLEKKIRVLRPLLGEILDPEEMCRPLLPLSQGRSIISSVDPTKYNLWYEINSRFGMIVFINQNFIEQKKGIDHALQVLKHRHPEREFGYCPYPADEKRIIPKGLKFDKTRTVLALSRFESFLPDELLHDREKVFLCSNLNQRLRGFCIAPALEEPHEVKMRFFVSIFKFIGLAVFIFWIANLRFGLRLSIKLKLLFLLAYSLLVPAGIIFFIAWDQYQQTRVEQVKNEQESSLKILQTLDKRFDEYLDLLGSNLRRVFDSHENSGKRLYGDPEEISIQKKFLIEHFHADAILVYDKEKKEVMRYDRIGLIKNSAMLKMLGAKFLKFSQGEIGQPEKDLRFMDFAEEFMRDENEVKFLGLGNFSSYSCFRVLKGVGEKDGDLMMMIFWDMDNLQRVFIRNFYAVDRQLLASRKIFAALYHDLVPILGDSSDYMAVLPTMIDAGQEKFAVYNNFNLNQRDQIAVSYVGKELNRVVFSLITPSEIVDRKMHEIFRKSLWGVLILIILTLGVIHFAGSYLLSPLMELRNSIEAFSMRNFRYRAEVDCENELGKLAETFNHSFETLEDLDVARIVQETLFPQENHKFQQIRVQIHGRTMSRLGGDCFSIAAKNESWLQIFLGDASGHGVAAAMSVAMAKSVLIYEENEGFPSGNTLERLNLVFAGQRKHRKADLMTALLLEINGKSGEFNFFNAGQIFPVIMDSTGTSLTYLKHSGFPIGLRQDTIYPTMNGKLSPGERMLLLTDGIVEAVMPDKTPFGFERLEQVLLKSFDKNLDKFKIKILNLLQQSGLQFIDDVTLILVQYDAE
ncbi:MAG: SpoIIE family protein phosphatase [Candidatus Riflebacteria bacterium]